jgi:hypothetical protein
MTVHHNSPASDIVRSLLFWPYRDVKWRVVARTGTGMDLEFLDVISSAVCGKSVNAAALSIVRSHDHFVQP